MTRDPWWVGTHPTPGTTGRADGEGVWERCVHTRVHGVKLLNLLYIQKIGVCEPVWVGWVLRTRDGRQDSANRWVYGTRPTLTHFILKRFLNANSKKKIMIGP